MQNDPRAIQAILSVLPQQPENDQAAQLLQRLAKQSSIVRFPFTYTAEFWTTGAANNIAAGAVGTVNVQIDAAAPFLIVSQSFFANSLNAAASVSAQPAPSVVVLLTDTGTNRQLMDRATPITAIFGTGQFPHILAEPKLMQANSQLQCQATNKDAAAGFNLWLAFNGYKLYTQ